MKERYGDCSALDRNEEVFASGKTKYIPEEILHLNGKTRIVSLVKTPLKDNEGKIWGLLGFRSECRSVCIRKDKIYSRRNFASEWKNKDRFIGKNAVKR